jgi:hypothetical protein
MAEPEDASVPETPSETAIVARIEAIAKNARTIWLSLLGYLAFVVLTLRTVRDADFFSAASETTLPIISVAIPTTSFFWAAPWLGAFLHAYLHLYLGKLWDALAEAPPEIAGIALGDRIFPWLANDWALRRRPDQPLTKRPLDPLGDLVTTLVVWLATPLVITAFWWRSMPAHLPWLTLTIAAALALTLYVSTVEWRRAGVILRKSSERKAFMLGQPLILAGSGALIALLSMASLARTAIELSNDTARWRSLAPIDLVGAEIVVKPDDWLSRETAERRFRIVWCRDRGIPNDACEPPIAPYQITAREQWCSARGIDDCDATFSEIDRMFEEEWSEERGAYLANLTRPDLRRRDLRGADASNAFFAGVDLSGAWLDSARLHRAQLVVSL